jgi:hypothetical protein
MEGPTKVMNNFEQDTKFLDQSLDTRFVEYEKGAEGSWQERSIGRTRELGTAFGLRCQHYVQMIAK